MISFFVVLILNTHYIVISTIYKYGLYPFFSLLKIQPSGTAFAPAKSYTFKR